MSELLWTYNTYFLNLESILENGLNGEKDTGVRFRHGIDSQYGDVIIVMSKSWKWQECEGYNFVEQKKTTGPFIGHFFGEQGEEGEHNNFKEYGNDTKNEIDKMLKKDQDEFKVRKTNVVGSGFECKMWLNKDEKQEKNWDDMDIPTWCFSQMNLAGPVQLKTQNVAKIYVPQWLQNHEITQRLLNTTFKVEFYGSPDKNNVYDRIKEPFKSDPLYSGIETQSVGGLSNCRSSYQYGNSSKICISRLAFSDVEKKYIKDIGRRVNIWPSLARVEILNGQKYRVCFGGEKQYECTDSSCTPSSVIETYNRENPHHLCDLSEDGNSYKCQAE